MPLVINGRFLARPVSGTERYARLLLRIIAREWPDSLVVVPKRSSADIDAGGLSIVRHGLTRGHVWEQIELPNAVGRDDVLLSLANTGPLRVACHVPVVHDLAFLHQPAWFTASFAKWYASLIPRMVRRAARVITVSGTVRDEIQRAFGVERTHLAVVPPFVSPTLIGDNGCADLPRPYYLMTGSFDPRKGIDRAIAWYTALQRPGFDLVLVGRPGRVFAPVHLPSHPGIRVLSDVDDARLSALYRNAIALLQPSLYEGFGLPVLEALALGCPVIASPLPVFTELFGDAVLTADIGPTDDMARTIELLDDPQQRASQVAKGHARAATFTETRTTAALREVIAPLLRDRCA